ncbi:M56 family metallopeptidase [Winogradskyella sp.]|uniref:M56 family metallopeptidase n=1 Tax=Winogradskyella sp. TaxID=1883156 RepID=UPI003F6AFB3B
MEYLLKASIVLAIFYLCYYFFLRKETFFTHNRWFLLTGLFVALIFPLVVIPIQITVEDQTIPQQLYTYAEPTSTKTEQQIEWFNWHNFFFTIYIIGLIVFLVQFLIQFGSLIWLLLTNPKNKDGIYTYVIVKNRISPFSFFKWIVYNPQSFDKNELQLMLTHEKVHANQLHSVDILLTQLACSVFWFNPFIWLYRKNVKQNLEYIADFQTQFKSSQTKEYQHLLLKASIADQQISLSNNFYNSLIKERIIMLQKSRSKRKKQWRYLLMLPILAGLLMSMNTETIYVASEDYMVKQTNVATSTDLKHIEIVFTNSMSDEQLESIKQELEANGVTMTIDRLSRNNKGLISDIKIEFSTANGSANYKANEEDGIKSFYFKLNDDGSFGVGPFNKDETVIVEEIQREHSKENSRPSVLIFKEEDEDKVVEIRGDSTGRYKVNRKAGNTFIFKEKDKSDNLHKDHDTVHIVTGYKNKSKNDSTYVIGYKIDSTEVLKTFKIKTDNYFEDDNNADIIIHDKNVSLFSPKTNSANNSFLGNDGDKPLIIVNGERMSYDLIKRLNPNQIDSMTVLKGDDAVNTYGKEANDGVIIIKLKDLKNSTIQTKTNTDGPWKITTEVSGYTYVYDDDKSKSATFGIVTKTSSDKTLEDNKKNLEQLGITVKYSKLKRNKLGLITSIKITLKNDQGDQSSATYKDNDGIAKVEYGVIGNKLVVRSIN